MTVVVGLTGGIATGKSTVAGLFEKLGVSVVYADKVAHEVMARGGSAHAQLLSAFGSDVVDANGQVDRAWLANMVFSDPEALRTLNAIVHPCVEVVSEERLSQLKHTDVRYVLYEAALLVETGRYKDFDALIVVHSTPEEQAARLATRDKLSPQEIKARMNAQAPAENKLLVADYVIRNHGSIQDLSEQVLWVHESLQKRFGNKA